MATLSDLQPLSDCAARRSRELADHVAALDHPQREQLLVALDAMLLAAVMEHPLMAATSGTLRCLHRYVSAVQVLFGVPGELLDPEPAGDPTKEV